MIKHAIAYYEDKVLPFKNYREPTEWEKIVLVSLHGSLRLVQAQHDATVEYAESVNSKEQLEAFGGEQAILSEAITSVVYEVGKNFYGEEKNSLREFFQMVYEVVMGQSNGPRLPMFVMLLGVDKFLAILKDRIR